MTLEPDFDVFELISDALQEPAWSRIFAALMDSTGPHRLGTSAARTWLESVAAEARGHETDLALLLKVVRGKPVVRSSVEHVTRAGRRIDVLLRVIDDGGHVAAVIGIENKIAASEQRDQICDYQTALREEFPSARRLVVFLTPDGREATTADDSSSCPCVPVSYRTVTTMCAMSARTATGDVKRVLDGLRREVERAVLGEDHMTNKAAAIVRQLMNEGHGPALRLIARCVPTARRTWDTLLVPRVLEIARWRGMTAEESDVCYYPRRSEAPREIRLCCAGLVGEKCDALGFSLEYMLHADRPGPDIGSEFVARVMAWCPTARSRKNIQTLGLDERLPATGERREWGNWKCVWTGRSYVLRDLDHRDVEGLAAIFKDAVRKTYPAIERAVLRARPTERRR